MKGSGFLQTTTITPPPPNPPAVAVVRQGVAAAEARRDPAGGHTCESHAMETTYHGARVCRAVSVTGKHTAPPAVWDGSLSGI